MAGEKKKKPAASGSGARSGTGSGKKRPRGKKTAGKEPIRREVGAVVCLFLSVFTILCCFHINAAFLDFISAVIFSIKASTVMVSVSTESRTRTETVPFSSSLPPATSI